MYRVSYADTRRNQFDDEIDFDNLGDDRWFDVLLWVKDRIIRMKPDEEITIVKL